MAGISIDIGSTATKAVVADPSGAIAFNLVIPTGFSSVEVAEQVRWALVLGGLGALVGAAILAAEMEGEA